MSVIVSMLSSLPSSSSSDNWGKVRGKQIKTPDIVYKSRPLVLKIRCLSGAVVRRVREGPRISRAW